MERGTSEEARAQERGVGLRPPEKDMGLRWLALLGGTCTTVGAKHHCCGVSGGCLGMGGQEDGPCSKWTRGAIGLGVQRSTFMSTVSLPSANPLCGTKGLELARLQGELNSPV